MAWKPDILGRWRREPDVNIRRLYLINMFRSSGIFMPVVVAYYKDITHVDFAGFLIGEACFAAGMVLLEIPTGFLSDIWKRRVTMIVSGMFWTLSYIYMLFARNLFDLIIVQLMMAVAASLSSGTMQAMLFEYLAENGREADFRRAEGQRFAYSFYAQGLVAPLAGFLYVMNAYLPLAITIAAHMLMLYFSFRLREPARIQRPVERNAFYDMMATMKYALYGHREIAAIIMLAAVLFTGTKLFMWSQQPYYAAAQIPLEWYGLLSAASYILVAVNSQLVHKLDKWAKPIVLLGLLLAGEIALATLAGAFILPVFAVMLLLGQAVYGLGSPVVADIIAQRAEPARRATILSAQSLLAQLLFTVLSLPFGYIAERVSIGAALWSFAAVLITLGGPAWFYLRWRVKRPLSVTPAAYVPVQP